MSFHTAERLATELVEAFHLSRFEPTTVVARARRGQAIMIAATMSKNDSTGMLLGDAAELAESTLLSQDFRPDVVTLWLDDVQHAAVEAKRAQS